jgi:UDP-glucose 4-epimerase
MAGFQRGGFMNVLVTGGAGYIGSHAVRQLLSQHHRVIVVDDFSHGKKTAIDPRASIVGISIGDHYGISKVLRDFEVEAIMHFAAFIEVGESVAEPLKYYENNVSGAIALLKAAQLAGVKKFVFSSTAAVYGQPKDSPILESALPQPINPYGRSKRTVEMILEDLARTQQLGSVIFRYFNVAGASEDASIGEDHEPETHLIPNILNSALDSSASLSIFGDDYPTRDGTCVRDYIHVVDLVEAHILALSKIEVGQSKVYNLGSQKGFTVLEVLAACEKTIGRKIMAQRQARRPGDPAILVASSQKAKEELGWKPRYPEIEEMIAHAWAWHQKKIRSERIDAALHAGP